MIGICTPYGHNETTATALRLADLALSLSLDVRLLSTGHAAAGVHPYWDSRVSSPCDKGVYLWAKGCQHLVWMEHLPSFLSKSLLVAEKAHQYLVPQWHQLPLMGPERLKPYQRIVCPSHAVRDKLVENLFQDVDSRRVTWCPWDSGLTPIERHGPVHRDEMHLYVPLDSYTLDMTGMFVLCLISDLLEALPALYITLSVTKSWPRKARAEIRALKERWGPRLVQTYARTALDQVTDLQNHDWTFLPALRANSGFMALRSLACHTPVIAYDIAPFNELIHDQLNGQLITCESTVNWLQAPIALPAFAATLEVLRSCLDGDQPLHVRRRRPWRRTEQADTFEEFWGKEWGIEL